ncbi:MAG: hypothetical protein ACOYOI_05470 [Chthoniobacterales bacterium]
MKKILPLLLVALVFGIGGYLAGIRIGISAIKSSDIAALVWITGIHQFLEKGKYDQAKRICFDAANIHFHVLQQMEEHPWVYLAMVPGWQFSGQAKQLDDISLTRSKAFYLPQASKMEPTSRTYLENIKEVPLPARYCFKPVSTNSATPTATP